MDPVEYSNRREEEFCGFSYVIYNMCLCLKYYQHKVSKRGNKVSKRGNKNYKNLKRHPKWSNLLLLCKLGIRTIKYL